MCVSLVNAVHGWLQLLDVRRVRRKEDESEIDEFGGCVLWNTGFTQLICILINVCQSAVNATQNEIMINLHTFHRLRTALIPSELHSPSTSTARVSYSINLGNLPGALKKTFRLISFVVFSLFNV